MINVKNRDNNIDILRGFATVLVVLGHTMTGSTINSEESLLFNFVWCIQMPLFFLISGYVTKYSKETESIKLLLKDLLKKTITYLLPWFVWSIFIRDGIFSSELDSNFLNFIYHMDYKYWFLFSIWNIVIIFLPAKYFAKKISKKYFPLFTLILSGVGMVILGLIGLYKGINFLGIKYTLYYMPFYLLGFIYSQIKSEWKKKKTLKDGLIAVCGIIWFILLLKINLYTINDNLIGIFIRFIASLFGCITVISGLLYIIKKFELSKEENHIKWRRKFLWLGTHTMEIYLLHVFTLNILKFVDKPSFTSPEGIMLVIFNTFITIVITCPIITFLESNSVIRYVLFGKK